MDKCSIPFEIPDSLTKEFSSWYGGNTKRFINSLVNDHSDPRYTIWRKRKMTLSEYETILKTKGGLKLENEEGNLSRRSETSSESDFIPSSQPPVDFKKDSHNRLSRISLSLNQSAKKIDKSCKSSDSGISSKPKKSADQPRKASGSEVSDSEDSDREFKRKQKMAAKIKLAAISKLRAKQVEEDSSDEDCGLLTSNLNRTLGINTSASHYLYANSTLKRESVDSNELRTKGTKVMSKSSKSPEIKKQTVRSDKPGCTNSPSKVFSKSSGRSLTQVLTQATSSRKSHSPSDSDSSLNVFALLPKQKSSLSNNESSRSEADTVPKIPENSLITQENIYRQKYARDDNYIEGELDSDLNKRSSIKREQKDKKRSSTSGVKVSQASVMQQKMDRSSEEEVKGIISKQSSGSNSESSSDDEIKDTKVNVKALQKLGNSENKASISKSNNDTSSDEDSSYHSVKEGLANFQKNCEEGENRKSSDSDESESDVSKKQKILSERTHDVQSVQKATVIKNKELSEDYSSSNEEKETKDKLKNVNVKHQDSDSSSESSDGNNLQPVQKAAEIKKKELSEDSSSSDEEKETKDKLKTVSVKQQSSDSSSESSNGNILKPVKKAAEIKKKELSADNSSSNEEKETKDKLKNVKVKRQNSDSSSETSGRDNVQPVQKAADIKKKELSEEYSSSDEEKDTKDKLKEVNIKSQKPESSSECSSSDEEVTKVTPSTGDTKVTPPDTKVKQVLRAEETSSESSEDEKAEIKQATKSDNNPGVMVNKRKETNGETREQIPKKKKVSLSLQNENTRQTLLSNYVIGTKGSVQVHKRDSLNVSQFAPEFSSSFVSHDEDWLCELKEINNKLWESVSAPKSMKKANYPFSWDNPKTKVIGLVQLPKAMNPSNLEGCRLSIGKKIGKYEVASVHSPVTSMVVAFPESQHVRAVSIPQSVVLSEQLLEVSLPEIEMAEESDSDEDTVVKTPLPKGLKRRNPLLRSPTSVGINRVLPVKGKCLPNIPVKQEKKRKNHHQILKTEPLSPVKELKKNVKSEVEVDDVISKMLAQEEEDMFDSTIEVKKKKKKHKTTVPPDDLINKMILEEEEMMMSLPIVHSKKKKTSDSQPVKLECKIEEDPVPVVFGAGEPKKQKRNKDKLKAEASGPSSKLVEKQESAVKEKNDLLPLLEQVSKKQKKKKHKELVEAVLPADIVKFECKVEEDNFPVMACDIAVEKKKTKKHKQQQVEQAAVGDVSSHADIEDSKKITKQPQLPGDLSAKSAPSPTSKKQKKISEYMKTAERFSETAGKKKKKTEEMPQENIPVGGNEISSQVVRARGETETKIVDPSMERTSKKEKAHKQKINKKVNYDDSLIQGFIEARAAELAAEKMAKLGILSAANSAVLKTEDLISDIKVEEHNPQDRDFTEVISKKKKKKDKELAFMTENVSAARTNFDESVSSKVKKMEVHPTSDVEEPKRADDGFLDPNAVIIKKKKKTDRDYDSASSNSEEIERKKKKKKHESHDSDRSNRGIVIDSKTVSLCSDDEVAFRKRKGSSLYESPLKKCKR